MRIRSAISISRKGYFDPANWLHESPAQHNKSGQAHIRTRSAARQNSIRSGLTVERLDWRQAGQRLDAWTELVQNAVEPNIFLEPAFALSAAQHFAPADQPAFVIISESGASGENPAMLGLFAFQSFNSATGMVAKLWHPPQMALGGPLIDAKSAIPVLDAIHDWLAREYSHISGILLSSIHTQGPLASIILSHARMRGLQTRELDTRTRSIVHNHSDAKKRIADTIGSKRNKELRRLSRKLETQGKLKFVSCNSSKDLQSAVEQFLSLEASGWKGKQGTALLCDPSLTLFARTMARRFSIHGQIEVDALLLDNKPVAMGIVIRSGNEAYYWKTAYDEAYSAYSPGVLLTLKLSERLLANPGIEMINSCAMPNHPMIDHLWPDQVEMMDLLVARKGRGERSFQAAASIEGARRKLRSAAKRAYRGLKSMRA